MKKLQTLLVLITLSISIFAQNSSEFKPSGKPIIKIFSNYHTTFSDGEASNAFELKRAYFGYDYAFSKNFSAKIVFDVGNPGVGKLQMTAFLKNAYLKYKYQKLTINFGLISTTAFKTQEKFWGYRYIYKSFQDEFKFNSSADLGMSFAYKFTDFLSADFSVLNGEGYKQTQLDNTMQAAFGLTLKPIENLVLRAYTDYMKKADAQQTMVFFAGYTLDKLSIGAEYNDQMNHDIVKDEDYSGYSFYATYKVNRKWKVFGRYDDLSSVKIDNEEHPWNYAKDGQLIIAGFEFSPAKGVKIAPNYQGWTPADSDKKVVHGAYVNCEIKL